MAETAENVLPPRHVTLVLCLPDGTLLGALPPYDVGSPYWPEVADVVPAARERYGVDVTVLRLVGTDVAREVAGGPVTYLAQVAEVPDVDLLPWEEDDPLAQEPLRQLWAQPGGPDRDLAWADEVLVERGTPRVGPARQVRTWNLSSLWRLPTADGAVWLKVVPPFFAHEGAMLGALPPDVVPPLVATDGPRVLLREIPGDDQYGAPVERLLRMVPLLVGLQVEWAGRVDALLELGLPDWRAPALAAAAEGALERTAADLPADVVSTVSALVAGLADRMAGVASCGLPDTLVHGDFHPGNVRGDDQRLVLLDWGDCGVGHPLLDQAAFVERLTPRDRDAVLTAWARLWRDALPTSDPERASALLQPVAALRQAVIYDHFLTHIEPSERVYHAPDPATWLRRAAALAERPLGGP
jgi:hypothetical protein